MTREQAVALVEDVAIYRHGLREALGRSGFRIDSPVDMMSWVLMQEEPPSAIVSVKSECEKELIEHVHHYVPHATVVALLVDDEPHRCVEILSLGAHAVCSWTASPETVVTALDCALRGMICMPCEAGAVLRSHMSAGTGIQDLTLNAYEHKLLTLLSLNRSIKGIATGLGYSERSIHRHLRSLYVKLGVSGRMDAVLYAGRLGLIS